ncbi:MAG TPA: PspC domain-containing protein [Terriglobales bacterium]|nr:PspC domain-containing protein [Terriglobales bacterium]
MYCNACGTEFRGRYCHQCGRTNPGAPPPHRAPLERPRAGRKIGGVCLALANNFDLDVNLVRVLWVVFTVLFAVAFGVIAYIAAWILIPEAPLAALSAGTVATGPISNAPGARTE